MKKTIWTMMIILVMSIDVNSLDVAESELKSAGKVNFVNYKGPKGRSDTVQTVRSIGTRLASGLEKSGKNQFRYANKYSITHVESEDEPDKFSADIFSIDRNAGVTTIIFVRHMISGYLQERYNYSRQNGDTLALFITYYNAFYRGNVDYLKSKYKTVVMDKINARNAGLSTKYYEWPGRSRILIPLTADGKGKVDPFAISNKDVEKAIRKDDNNLDKRKDLVKLKEDELKKDRDRLDKLRKDIDDRKRDLDKNKDSLSDEDRLKREKALRDAEKAKRAREKAIRDKKKDIGRDKDNIRNDRLDKDFRKNPKRTIEKLRKKAKDLDEREDRLRDKKVDKNIFGNSLYYLKVKKYITGGHYNNEMLMIDAATGRVTKTSPFRDICGRRFDIFSGGIIVITHRGDHNARHRLSLLDRKTLKPIKHGEGTIFWRSFIEVRDKHIYAISIEDNQYFLAKYDNNLKLVAQSKTPIGENTFISFFQDFIYINGKGDNNILILKKDNLERHAVINP